MTQKFHSCESIQEKWKCMTQTLYTNVQNSFMHRAKCPPRQEWETVMNIWCKLGQLLFLLDLCLVVRFSQWEGRSVRRLECRKKKSLGYLPFPLTALALWFGQQCIPEVPIKGSFLRFNWIFIFRGKQRPHLEPVFSEECKTGNTAEQCQVSLFNRSFCCSPCHNCIGTRGQGSYPGRLFYHSSSSP